MFGWISQHKQVATDGAGDVRGALANCWEVGFLYLIPLLV